MKKLKVWDLYDAGRRYNNSLRPNQYNLVKTNIEFFNGNQWLNLPSTPAMDRLPKPTFNIIKRIVQLFVAQLAAGNTQIRFSPLIGGPDSAMAEYATDEVRNLLEKFKFEYRIRDAMFDGAITGDYCAHFYWDAEAVPYGGTLGPETGEIKMEMVDGINVLFGNPNIRDVEKQPYIIILGRDWTPEETTAGVRHNVSDRDDGIYALMYRKVHGTVHVTKATKKRTVYEDVDTGLTRYPIAWGNWERQKNQYHGRALVTGLVPSQTYINAMFAMIFYQEQTNAFPIRYYNADYLPNLTNELGVALGVHNLLPGQDLGSLVATIPPADMSNQVLQTIDAVMQYAKDCVGATDVQMGSARPDNTSALIMLQQASEVPLENIRCGLYEWIEDIGAVLLDMIGTYYGRRPFVHSRTFEEPVTDASGVPIINPATGKMFTRSVSRLVSEEVDFSQFKRLWFRVGIDVGEGSTYSMNAEITTLENLRKEGIITIIEYLERMPNNLIPRKTELIENIRKRAESPNSA